MKARFFYCRICGNLVVKLIDSGVTPVCCSTDMIELQANEIEGAGEKHLPVTACCTKGKVNVAVGSILHPMTKDHFIQFIAIETKFGGQIRYLSPDDDPIAEFDLAPGDKPLVIYAYCNIHGLWMSKCK